VLDLEVEIGGGIGLHFSMTTLTAGDVVTELDFTTAERINEIAARYGATPA
jgi:4a-hydroxytetrahydrobiopterin dehydratase